MHMLLCSGIAYGLLLTSLSNLSMQTLLSAGPSGASNNGGHCAAARFRRWHPCLLNCKLHIVKDNVALLPPSKGPKLYGSLGSRTPVSRLSTAGSR